MSNDLGKNQNTMTEFVDALERHVERTSIFYDEDFADLIIKYFPFKNISITVYDKNFEHIGALPRNNAIRAAQYYIDVQLQEHDYMSQYVSASYEQLESRKDIVLGSQVTPSNPQSGEAFQRFLQAGNLKYLAVLPVDKVFRIVVYKQDYEGDFTEQEIELLRNLLIISRSKYQSFKNLKACRNLSKIKSDLLDRLHIGYITLNQDFHVLDCNSRAIECLAEMWGTTHIQNIVEKIRETFPNINLTNGQIIYKNHVLTTCAYSEMDYFGRLQRYYYFTMMEADQASQAANQKNSPLQFSLLSAREMEVLDAFAHGLEYKEISEQLFISEGTVRTHLKSIYRKLDINNQRKLIYEYAKYSNFQ